MPNIFRQPAFTVAMTALILPAAIPAVAQPAGGLIYTVIIPAGEFGSAAFTSVVVGGLAEARKFCAELDDGAYRVDCLAERFGVVAGLIPKDSDYGEVQEVLKSVSDRLAALARANRDRTLPRARATRTGTSQTTSRPLTPIASAAAQEVNQQALEILQKTETLLLRSAEGSSSKIAQYAQIADAIGSNKVLLRSA